MHDSNIPALASVLAASLLGSPHCAAMCGGFATLAAGASERFPQRRVGMYHLGRLFSYIAAGFGAASLSSLVSPFWIGIALVTIGILSILAISPVPSVIHRTMTLGYRGLIAKVPRSSLLFPLIIGFASAFLPCGWLYVYVGMAAVSHSPILTMTVFWIGTIPMLTFWSAASSWMLNKFGRYFPVLQAGLLIFAGLFSVLQHVDMSPSPSHCDHHAHVE